MKLPRLMRIGETGHFLLGLAAIFGALIVTGGAWWFWPVSPGASWPVPADCWRYIVSANGQRMATFHLASAKCIMWHVPSGEKLGTLEWTESEFERSWGAFALISPDGETVVAYDDGAKRLEAWNPAWPKPLIPLADSFPEQFVYSADSKFLFASLKQGARVWNLATQKEIATPWLEKGRCYVQATDNGLLLLVPEADEDSAVFVGEASNLQKRTTIKGLRLDGIVWTVSPCPLTVSADGRVLAGQSGHGVVILDLETGHERCRIEKDGVGLALEKLSPDGTRVLTSSEKTTSLWDISGDRAIHVGELPFNYGTRLGVEFAGNGRWLVALSMIPNGTNTKVFETKTARLCYDVDKYAFASSPNGSTLVTEPILAPTIVETLIERITASVLLQSNLEDTRTGRIVVREIGTGAVVAELRDCLSPVFHPAGDSLFTIHDRNPTAPVQLARRAGQSVSMCLWDIPPGRPLLIEYGSPALFGLLLISGIWYSLRSAKTQVPATSAANDHSPASPLEREEL